MWFSSFVLSSPEMFNLMFLLPHLGCAQLTNRLLVTYLLASGNVTFNIITILYFASAMILLMCISCLLNVNSLEH